MSKPSETRFPALRADTAYWRLNSRYARTCTAALALSIIGHWLYLAFGPAPEAKPYELENRTIEVIDIPDEIEVPKPPERIERPPLPEEAEIADDVDETETIEPTQLDLEQIPVRPTHTEGLDGFVAFDTPPEPLSRVLPAYPELARSAGAEGRVVVEVTIDQTGRVVQARVVDSNTIPVLEEAALRAASRWLFRPARQRDMPVKARFRLPFTFRLR